jgi:hypothetical protein
MRIGGILGLVLLVIFILALVRLLQSRVEPATKIVWLLLIIFLPGLGPILYFLIGPKS